MPELGGEAQLCPQNTFPSIGYLAAFQEKPISLVAQAHFCPAAPLHTTEQDSQGVLSLPPPTSLPSFRVTLHTRFPAVFASLVSVSQPPSLPPSLHVECGGWGETETVA